MASSCSGFPAYLAFKSVSSMKAPVPVNLTLEVFAVECTIVSCIFISSSLPARSEHSLKNFCFSVSDTAVQSSANSPRFAVTRSMRARRLWHLRHLWMLRGVLWLARTTMME